MKKRGLWVILLSLVAMIVGLSRRAVAEEGVTDTEIHIGQWGPQTGPGRSLGGRGQGNRCLF